MNLNCRLKERLRPCGAGDRATHGRPRRPAFQLCAIDNRNGPAPPLRRSDNTHRPQDGSAGKFDFPALFVFKHYYVRRNDPLTAIRRQMADTARRTDPIAWGGVRQPSARANLRTLPPHSNIQSPITAIAKANDSVADRTQSHLFRKMSETNIRARNASPDVEPKRNTSSSYWDAGPASGFQSGLTLSQTSACAFTHERKRAAEAAPIRCAKVVSISAVTCSDNSVRPHLPARSR